MFATFYLNELAKTTSVKTPVYLALSGRKYLQILTIYPVELLS